MAFSTGLARGALIAACLAMVIPSGCSRAQSQRGPDWQPAASLSDQPFLVGANIRPLRDDNKGFQLDIASDLAALRGEGYRSTRFEWGLATVETVAGPDTTARRLAAGGDLRPLVVLTGGGSARFAGGMPLSAGDVATFRGFAARASGRFGDGAIFEIWNEWNLPTPRREAGGASSYVALARETYRAMKAANPRATILAGVAGSEVGSGPYRADRLQWLDTALAQGLLDSADGLSIHLYNNCGVFRADPVAEMLWRLDQVHRAVLRAAGRSYPIYVTEVGWPTRSSPTANCGYPPQDAAALSARFLLAASTLPYVHGVWLYEWTDRAGAEGIEGRFGLKGRDGRAKAPGCDLAGVLKIISASRRRALRVDGGVYHFHGSGDSGGWDIYWREAASADAARPPAIAWDKARPLCSGSGPASETITGNPVIVESRQITTAL